MIPTNIREGFATARDAVGSAIERAAARTSVDFSYLFNQAKVESGLNPNAKARTSSATGLFQFIDQTWLGTVKKHGASHGLDWAADAIRCGPDGRYSVADPGVRQAILDLRNDPDAASVMAAEFARDNQTTLEANLDRPVQSVDLYLAHFLGAAGAADFLRAHDADPDAPAAAAMPKAARANRWVFFNRDGSPCSFAEIRNRFAAKIGGNGALPPAAPRGGDLNTNEFLPIRSALASGSAFEGSSALAAMSMPFGMSTAASSVTPAGSAAGVPAVQPQYARLAYLMLAELGA